MSADTPMSVRTLNHQSAMMVAMVGVLDAGTYLDTRNSIVKAATELPDVLIVDIRRTRTTTPSAWSVLTSAAWLIHDWPQVPLVVLATREQQNLLVDKGITRSVTVVDGSEPTLETLLDSRSPPASPVRSCRRIPRTVPQAAAAARAFVARTLAEWDRSDYIEVAGVATTVLVRNVIEHTASDPDVRVETHGAEGILVAVSDNDTALPSRREDEHGAPPLVSGLAVLTSLTHHWGCTPTGDGKTVWAVFGRQECARFT